MANGQRRAGRAIVVRVTGTLGYRNGEPLAEAGLQRTLGSMSISLHERSDSPSLRRELERLPGMALDAVPPDACAEDGCVAVARQMLSHIPEGQEMLDGLKDAPPENLSSALSDLYWDGFRFGFREAFR